MSAGHLVARHHQRMLAFCVKDVTRACTQRPRSSTQEIAHLILQTWLSDEEVFEDGVFRRGFLEGVSVKMLHRASQRMMRYRMRHAYRRLSLSPTDWNDYARHRSQWQLLDDEDVVANEVFRQAAEYLDSEVYDGLSEDSTVTTVPSHDAEEPVSSSDESGEQGPAPDPGQHEPWHSWMDTEWQGGSDAHTWAQTDVETSSAWAASSFATTDAPIEAKVLISTDGVFNVPSLSAWLPEGVLPLHLRPAPGCGRFTWKFTTNKPLKHSDRDTGPWPVFQMQGGKPVQFKDRGAAGSEMFRALDQLTIEGFPGYRTFRDAQVLLLNWLRARGLGDVLEGLEAYSTYPFDNESMTNLGGSWLYARVKGQPRPNRDTLPAGERYGFHGTSMYCIRRAVEGRSLTTGMAEIVTGGRSYMGVYYHKSENAHLCQLTYMLYTALNMGHMLFSPLIVIRSQIEPYVNGERVTGVCKRSGVDQMLTYEGNHELVGVLFHLTSFSIVGAKPKAHWYNVELSFLQELELPGLEYSWEDICKVSFQQRFVPPVFSELGDPAR